ncbi:MAG: Crp/Fnr family transcriptional regulator [Myxococcales bacterium]|nr:Crp/Fnr family transcriptional regulator [Myxococcales bacterium]
MADKLETIIGLNRQADLLRRVSIFRHLDETVLGDLARRMSVKRWTAGAIIVGQHEMDQALYIVYGGRAKVSLFGENGREITLATLRTGDFFGELSLIDSKPRAANVVAADDAILLVLDREAFLDHLEMHPRTMRALLESMASRVRSSADIIANLALHDVNSRLTRTLITLAEEVGEESEDGILIRYRPTQQDLANMVGTCRETVSRALSAMARRGLVVSRGRSLLLRPQLVASARRAA